MSNTIDFEAKRKEIEQSKEQQKLKEAIVEVMISTDIPDILMHATFEGKRQGIPVVSFMQIEGEMIAIENLSLLIESKGEEEYLNIVNKIYETAENLKKRANDSILSNKVLQALKERDKDKEFASYMMDATPENRLLLVEKYRKYIGEELTDQALEMLKRQLQD